MPYVRRIRSNLKGGCDVTLGHHTLLVGPKGSGKSTVANAVELVLTGRVDDVAGRASIALPAELLTLAPPKDPLTVEAEFDDGSIASVVVERTASGGKKPKVLRPTFVDPDTALPIRRVTEALTAGADKIRRFLFPIVVGKLTLKALEEGIPSALRPHFRKLLASIPTTTPPVDALLACLDQAEAEARSCSDRLRGSKRTLESASGGLPPAATEDELAAAKADVEKTTRALEEAQKVHAIHGVGAQERLRRAEQARKDLEKQKGFLLAAQEKVTVTAAARNQAEAALASIPQPTPLAQPLQDSVVALRSHPEISECYLCGGAMTPTAWANRKASIQQVLAARDAQTVAVVQAEGALTRAKEAAVEAEEAVRRAEQQIAMALQIIAEGEAASQLPPESLPDLDLLRARVGQAIQAVTQAEASRAAWSVVDRAQSDMVDAERQHGEWKQLADACSALVERHLDATAKSFMEKVQSRLPKDEHFVLQLRDGKRECVRVGLKRGTVIHTALSGGEWMLVVAAVADAIVEPGKFAVVRPEDRGVDAVSLSHILEALSSCQSQVVITSTVRPSRIPAGWTVIDTGKDEHRVSQRNTGDRIGERQAVPVLPPDQRTPAGAVITSDAASVRSQP